MFSTKSAVTVLLALTFLIASIAASAYTYRLPVTVMNLDVDTGDYWELPPASINIEMNPDVAKVGYEGGRVYETLIYFDTSLLAGLPTGSATRYDLRWTPTSLPTFGGRTLSGTYNDYRHLPGHAPTPTDDRTWFWEPGGSEGGITSTSILYPDSGRIYGGVWDGRNMVWSATLYAGDFGVGQTKLLGMKDIYMEVTTVPEPSNMATLASGFGGLMLLRRSLRF